MSLIEKCLYENIVFEGPYSIFRSIGDKEATKLKFKPP